VTPSAPRGGPQVVLDNLRALRHLDLKRVTEEERRQACSRFRPSPAHTLPSVPYRYPRSSRRAPKRAGRRGCG